MGFLTVVNLVGVRQGTTANNIFTVAKIIPLVIVIFAGTTTVILHPAAAAFVPRVDVPATSWLKATVLLVFLFGGFESALAPMSEAKSPRRDAVFALFTMLIVCTAIYTLVQWVVVEILGPAATTDRPLAEVARVTIGDRGAALVAIGAMLSVYGYLSAKLLGMPRVTFALAEQGDLPSVFSAVSRSFHTPWFSIIVFAVVVWVLAVIGSFAWNATLSVVARLFYYAVVCCAVIALRRRRADVAWFRLPAAPVFALLGTCLCMVLATQSDLRQSRILLVVVIAALANWLWVRRGGILGG